MRPGFGVKGRLGGKERGCRGGGAWAAYSGGRRSSKPQETGCPQVWGKRPQPQGPRAGMELIRDDGLSRPRRRVEDRTGRRPGRLSCPEPGGGGSLSETPASPAPERGYGRRCQAVTSPGLRRKTRPPRPSRGRGQRKAGSSAAGPRNRFRLRRCSGTVTDPRGRHDGLLAAPQRGQAPPRPRPPMTSGARLAWGPGPSRHRFRRHCGVFRLWSPCPPRSGPVRPVKCGSPEGQGEW